MSNITNHSGNTNFTFVFIHGAWHTSKVWTQLIDLLVNNYPDIGYGRPGFASIDLSYSILSKIYKTPIILFNYYIEYVKSQLNYYGQNIILVGHSSAGLIMQEIGNHPNIKKMVFINAFILSPGSCQFDLVPKKIADSMTELAIKSTNGCIPVDENFVRNLLMAGESENNIQSLLKQLVPQPLSLFITPVEKNPITINIPKYYIYCKDDVSLPQGAFLKMAALLGMFEFIMVDGGHETIFTNPKIIMDALMEIAKN